MRTKSKSNVESVPAAQDPHYVLRPLDEAARLAESRVSIVRVRMHWTPESNRLGPLGVFQKAFAYFAAHVRMVRDVRDAGGDDLVLVREFLTSMLALVWPFLWSARGRVCFLNNHNVQEAHQRGFERRLLRLMSRTGARFACNESGAGLAEIGVRATPDALLVLPVPIAELAPPRRSRAPGEPPVIGLIGYPRAEKGNQGILERLGKLRNAGGLPIRLVLGYPGAGDREDEWVELVDTAERTGYLQALDRCDVIVLNYEPDRYAYRSSGVAADAVSRRAAVACRDLPVLREQLLNPAPVASFFSDLDDLERALREAISLYDTAEPERWEEHARARSVEVIARLFDEFVRRGRLEAGAASESASARWTSHRKRPAAAVLYHPAPPSADPESAGSVPAGG